MAYRNPSPRRTPTDRAATDPALKQPAARARRPGPLPSHLIIGREAEQRAARFLRDAGMQILICNYTCRHGELDIVAEHDGVLIVAEVRCRSRDDFGGAAGSITHRKQRRIVRATLHLLASQPRLQRLPIRFDALLVPADTGAIQWLRGAFEAH